MRKLYVLLLLVCFTLLSQAQTRVSTKLGMQLYQKLQDAKYALSTQLKAIMVKGNPDLISGLVKKYNGTLRFSTGDISSVAIPYRNLVQFSQEAGIVSIENSTARVRKFMDTARINNNIDSALLGVAPLTQPYKGTGVIVGIIDGGIYFRHQDFRRANGNTRILYLWDQIQSTGSSPSPYAYGSEWDSTGINTGQCTSLDPAADFSHGTNVAGIAAGNGSSWDTGDAYLKGRYTGVAPDADMIVVRYNDTATGNQVIVDAVNYIFTKASQLGRPCAINISLGSYYGSHDGQDLAAQAINSMLEAQNGRVVVASAGNEGGLKFHLSYSLSPTDSLFTWFTYNHHAQIVYYDLWADTSQFKLANFAMGCESIIPAFKARTKYYTVDSFSPAQGVTNIIGDSLMQGSSKLGDYQIAVTLSGGTYHVEFQATPKVGSDLWSLQTIGRGTFDAWVDSNVIGGSSPVRTLPGGFSSPNYRFADSLKTIVSSWQCSDDVITVANYVNRESYLDVDSIYVTTAAATGSLAASSSIGPTRDNRIKPDIAATGDMTTATGDSSNIATLLASGANNRKKVALGGKHNKNSGTSMASPIVAGVAALYLQEHPHASFREVKQIIEATAKLDTFTTHHIPNVNWGWGKVNGYQALLYPVVYGCMDTGSFNYNSHANVDTGGCIAKVYGCTDTGSINYSASANTNNGTCIAKVYGCTDTASTNYSASANVNNGTCIPKVYGCTDTGSVNYDSLANTNNGSCIAKVYGITDSLCSNYKPTANVNYGICIPLGITQISNTGISFDVIPNPINDDARIVVTSKTPLVNASVKFYDMQGRQIDAINFAPGSKEVTYINNKLAPGIYDAALISDGKVIAVKKIVAE